jgi:hypothetical protein
MVAFGLVATGGNLETSDSRVESNATA